MRRLLLALLLALAACAEPPPPADTLRAGVPALPSSWGDPYRGEGTPGSYTWTALFDGLTALSPDGRIVPALATQWSSADGRRWTFQLRPGVRFSDDTPFDAAAAKASFDWLMSDAGKASVIGSRLRDVAGVEAPAPNQLVIHLKKPDAVFPKRLPSVAIVAPERWATLGPAAFAKAPAGTGPYRLLNFDERRRRASLVANPGSWRHAQIPRLDLIELGDEGVRQQALISGDIDIARVGIDEIAYLESRGIRLAAAPSMQVMSLAFALEGRPAGPLSDVRVRQALNLAIDREAIARVLLQGKGAPASQPGPRGTLGHDPALPPLPHDPARARALLAQAGYPKGFTLKADVVIGSLPADALIYQAMARYLAEIGVTTELRAIPFPVFLRRYLANDWADADAFGLSWNAAPYNDTQRSLENFSCLKRPKPFFCDAALAAAITAAGSEMNPQKRETMLRTLAAAHQQAAPALFLVEQIDLIGIGPRLTGPVPIANRVPLYETLRLRK
ncbi:ABC transporter substrate-binding protein [Polymorphobacter sp.]|uniref:ABC transporter substrate-binding protein n=1 Tax=Polymorphobacter sp. TaxID=1909290 RepID=UPI003F7207B1